MSLSFSILSQWEGLKISWVFRTKSYIRGEIVGVLNFLILSFKAWFWFSLVTNMNLHVHAQQASFLNHTISSDNVEQILCLLHYPVEKKRIRKFYFMSLKCSSKQICITDY